MGKLISFSEFDKYLEQLKAQGEFCPGTILDTNIIVSMLYEIKPNHDEVVDFLDSKIYENGIFCFTNVVTTAEFINIYRRILLTEHLADAVDEDSKLKLSKASTFLIKRLLGEYKRRFEHEKKDLIFSESDIKKIKDTFTGGPHSGLSTWPELSKLFLGDKLQMAYEAYKEVGIKYISPNSEEQKEYFQRITVSKEAQSTLGVITDRINDGFIGGRVNRTQMANWILKWFQCELDEALIKEIRAEHFDEVSMLENILKQAKESGKVPSDFKTLLQKQYGLEEPNKKKKPVALT